MNSNSYRKNEIRASTDEICYADEIFGYASDEIKSTHSPSRRISHAVGVFHIAKQYFTHPKGWISLKKTLSFDKVFFWCGRQDLNLHAGGTRT